MGHLIGDLIGGLRVDALELVEERQLLLLLLGVLGDLLALALDVGRGHFVLGSLGQKGAGGHRQRGGDRARQSGREDRARASRGARDAGHDPEHGGQPVVGAVDRAGDPAGAAGMPLLAAEDPVEPSAGSGDGCGCARPPVTAVRPAARRAPADPAPADRRHPSAERMSATASEWDRSSLRISRSSRSVSRSPVERLYRSSTSSSSAASRAASSRSTGAIRAWRRSHSGTLTVAGSGIRIPSAVIRSSRRPRWPLSASAMRRRMSASRGARRRAISP